MDWETARLQAIEWMQNRGWKRKLAKKRGGEQSLFEHTLIQLDVLISLFPLLGRKESFRLSLEEMQVLWLAALCHDVGKETEEWQTYIIGKGNPTNHCIPELAQEAVQNLLDKYGWEQTLLTSAISGVLLHMKNERTIGNVLQQVITPQPLGRWKLLSELVDAVDNLVSANGLFPALASLERSILARHLKWTYHQVLLRGASTSLLHRSAVQAFDAAGWQPLIHFVNGSIYVAPGNSDLSIPTRENISEILSQVVNEAMGQDFPQQVVGNPVASMVPKPDLFDYREMRAYLSIAATRVNPRSFLKKKQNDRQKTINKYILTLCQRDNRCSNSKECNKNQICKHPEKVLNNLDLDYQSERISNAYQEMVVFKFFKTVFSDKVINYQNFVLPKEKLNQIEAKHPPGTRKWEQAVKKAQKEIFDSFMDTVKNNYDRRFGSGSFELLQKTTTLMPHLDMAYAIDPYWNTAHGHLVSGESNAQIATLDNESRLKLLIETLAEIAEESFATLDEVNRPQRIKPHQIANHFLEDLVFPADTKPINETAQEQLESYLQTKPLARKAEGQHLCPICNKSFKDGTNAKADFLDNPESHTNRAPAHGSPGYIVICDICKFERFLLQQMLKGKAAQTMVLMPRINIGYQSGLALQRQVQKMWQKATILMSASSPDPNLKFSFSLTGQIAKELQEKNYNLMGPEELAEIFTYRVGKEKAQEYRRKMKALLTEECQGGLAEWNATFDVNYATEEEFLNAVENSLIEDELGTLQGIRQKAFNLIPQMELICETPHFILIPVRNRIAVGDDSDVNAGIRELFAMLIISLCLDCSVAILKEGEEFSFTGGEGSVRVPPIPALRKLIGSDWIGIKEAPLWLEAIGAAARLAGAAKYPERSNLYQILTSPTPGHILRRLEMQNDSGFVSPEYFADLEKVKEVLP